MSAASPRLHGLPFHWIKSTLLDCVLWPRCWSLFRKRWRRRRETTRPAAAGEQMDPPITCRWCGRFHAFSDFRKESANIKTAAVSNVNLAPFLARSPAVCAGWYALWSISITPYLVWTAPLSFLEDLIKKRTKKNASCWFFFMESQQVCSEGHLVCQRVSKLMFFTRNKPASQNRKVIQAVGFMIRCICLYRSFYEAVFPVAVCRLAGSFYLIVSQRQ